MKCHHRVAVGFHHGFALLFSRNMLLLPFSKNGPLSSVPQKENDSVILPMRTPVILPLGGNTDSSRFPKDFLSKFKYVDINYNKKEGKCV